MGVGDIEIVPMSTTRSPSTETLAFATPTPSTSITRPAKQVRQIVHCDHVIRFRGEHGAIRRFAHRGVFLHACQSGAGQMPAGGKIAMRGRRVTLPPDPSVL